MTRYDQVYFQLLRALCTGQPHNVAALKALPEFEAAARRVRRFDPMKEEHADVLFAGGVLAEGCVRALLHYDDPEIQKLVGIIYSKLLDLYPMWRALTEEQPEPVTSAPTHTPPSAAPSAPEDPDAGLRQFLVDSGFDPRVAEMTLDDMVADIRNKTDNAT